MRNEPGHRETQARDGLIAGTLLTVAGLALFIVILFVYGSEAARTSLPEPPLPSDIPTGIPWLGDFEREIRVDDGSFLIPYGVEARIKVIFPPQDSIKGLWSGTQPEFAMLEPAFHQFGARSQTDSWGSLLLTQGYDLSSFTPCLEAAFTVDRQYHHQWLSVNAKLGVVYPVFAGIAGKFVDQSSVVEHDFRLYVTSPEEYQMVLDHEEWEWEDSQSLADPGMAYFFSALCFFPGVLILIIEIITIRKLRRS